MASNGVRVHVSRGMTLVELAVVAAVAGIVASLGAASMVQLIEAEQARNEAMRFSIQLRRQRAEAMQQQQYTLVSVVSDPGAGALVTYQTRRLGTPTSNPCQEMIAGAEDTVRTVSFKTLQVDMATGASGSVNRLCLDAFGKPVTDLLEPTTAAIDVAVDNEPTLQVSVDAMGALASSDQPVASGIAQTSFFPLDLMMNESAPVPPNTHDQSLLPAYEVAPGEFVDAAGAPASDGTLGGDDDPCAYDPAHCDPCLIDPAMCAGGAAGGGAAP